MMMKTGIKVCIPIMSLACVASHNFLSIALNLAMTKFNYTIFSSEFVQLECADKKLNGPFLVVLANVTEVYILYHGSMETFMIDILCTQSGYNQTYSSKSTIVMPTPHLFDRERTS